MDDELEDVERAMSDYLGLVIEISDRVCTPQVVEAKLHALLARSGWAVEP